MKRILLLFLLTTGAYADELQDGGIVMSASERAFIFQKMIYMQEAIDKLQRDLQTEKIRTGCA